MLIQQSDMRNRVLATLSPAAFALLQPGLVRRSFEQGVVLERPDEAIAQVCFPEAGLASVVTRTPSGMRLETGLIGPEGMTGQALLYGIDRSPHESFVQIPCRAVCLSAEAFRDALSASRALHDRLLLCAYVFQVQVAQTALCSGRLMVVERLARWLLMYHDRADREDLPLTHEFLALMLGVRRPGITTALQVLEGAGALRMRRGIIVVRDRGRLLEAAGDSYGVPEAEYERVLGTEKRNGAPVVVSLVPQ